LPNPPKKIKRNGNNYSPNQSEMYLAYGKPILKMEERKTNIITEMKKEHWPEVEAIYLEGIKTKNATFETTNPGWGKWMASGVMLYYWREEAQLQEHNYGR
jgi:hypothetical protein